jgi:hypothetical protein
MQNFTAKKNINPALFTLLLLAIIILIPAGGVFAQEKTKKKTKKKKKVEHFELRVGLNLYYDNNILKYSEKYLERFMNGEDPGRFSIETYDDLIINPSLEGIYTFNIFKKLKTRINASLSPKFYVVNDIKNWEYYGIGLQQYISKRGFVKILYSYIPEFYVRNFRDDAWVDVFGYIPITFKPYSFSKDSYGAYIQNTFWKGTRVRLSLFHARYYHNQWFTEYDSKDWLYGINVNQRIHKNFRIEASYDYYTSDAKGYDAAYETPETTTGPDATYVEDRFSFGFDWRLPKLAKRKNDLTVEFNYLTRYYSSPYTPIEDPLHAGRVDANYRMYFTYHIDLFKDFDFSVYYNWLMRDSRTESPVNSEYVSNEKDYRDDVFGLKLRYSIEF